MKMTGNINHMTQAGLQLYRLNIHTLRHILMTPSSRVNESGVYCPSENLQDRIKYMWKHRKPRLIGVVSEELAMEIISGGNIRINQDSWNLTCERLRNIALKTGWIWKPNYGIRCDDIGTIADDNTSRLLFITECKGTTCQNGISRNIETKIRYQLARTFEKMDRTMDVDYPITLGGVVSIVIDHYSSKITINVSDKNSSFAGGLPDSWMYPEKSIDKF